MISESNAIYKIFYIILYYNVKKISTLNGKYAYFRYYMLIYRLHC